MVGATAVLSWRGSKVGGLWPVDRARQVWIGLDGSAESEGLTWACIVPGTTQQQWEGEPAAAGTWEGTELACADSPAWIIIIGQYKAIIRHFI